jgi:hypothetical protein
LFCAYIHQWVGRNDGIIDEPGTGFRARHLKEMGSQRRVELGESNDMVLAKFTRPLYISRVRQNKVYNTIRTDANKHSAYVSNSLAFAYICAVLQNPDPESPIPLWSVTIRRPLPRWTDIHKIITSCALQ